jgi:hypothetical protein
MFDEFMHQAASDLEKLVLSLLKEQKIKLPVELHKIVLKDGEPVAEADLFYDPKICVFIDGPDHDKEYIKLDDSRKRSKLKQLGYKVLVIHHLSIQNGIDSLKNSLN